jgi:elongation factor Ts
VKSCKEALENSGGDVELALRWLKKNNILVSNTRKECTTSSGVVTLSIDTQCGIIIKLLCETDFVAKSVKFLELAENIASIAIKCPDNDIDNFFQPTYNNGLIKDLIAEHINLFRENIILKEIKRISLVNGVIIPYVHSKYNSISGKIAVLVALEGDICPKVREFGKKLAMHIAVSNPIAISKDKIKKTILEQERNLYTYQAGLLGKSEIITQKIVEERINKYYLENVLLQQKFVMDETKSIEQVVQNLAKISKFKIKDFQRSEIRNK